jgi:hypothetical protein
MSKVVEMMSICSRARSPTTTTARPKCSTGTPTLGAVLTGRRTFGVAVPAE